MFIGRMPIISIYDIYVESWALIGNIDQTCCCCYYLLIILYAKVGIWLGKFMFVIIYLLSCFIMLNFVYVLLIVISLCGFMPYIHLLMSYVPLWNPSRHIWSHNKVTMFSWSPGHITLLHNHKMTEEPYPHVTMWPWSQVGRRAISSHKQHDYSYIADKIPEETPKWALSWSEDEPKWAPPDLRRSPGRHLHMPWEAPFWRLSWLIGFSFGTIKRDSTGPFHMI